MRHGFFQWRLGLGAVEDIASRIEAVDEVGEVRALLESGSIYHSEAWRNVLTEGFGTRFAVLASRSQGKLMAILPFYSRTRFGVRFLGSPLSGTFSLYLGPLIATVGETRSALNAWKSQLAALRGMWAQYIEVGCEIRNVPFDDLNQECGAMGFEYLPRSSLELTLAGTDDALWARLDGRARNMIRKAEKSGVMAGVEPLTSILLEEYYAVIERTFASRKMRAPHSLNAYRALDRHVNPTGHLVFVGARFEGQLVSGGIFLLDRNRMIFHSGGSTQAGLLKAAASLVQWNAIREAKRREMSVYDFGGTGIESIDRFKKSFGGHPVIHHRWVYMVPLLRRFRALGIWAHRRGLLKVTG